MSQRLSPIGFWSYSRQDDEASRGSLSTLRSLLLSELQQQYGRDRVNIFQDLPAIPPGSQWEDEIRNSLGNSTFLIPIITPAFIESEWCNKEVAVFLEREKEIWNIYPEIAGRRRIFPIYYINIDDVDPYDPLILKELKRLQWVNFTSFRNRNDSDEAVKDILTNLASSLCRLLRIRVSAQSTEDRKVADPESRYSAGAHSDGPANGQAGTQEAEGKPKVEAISEAEANARTEREEAERRNNRIAQLRAANEAEVEAAQARKRDEADAKREADKRAAQAAREEEDLRQLQIARLKAANEAEIEAAKARKREEAAASRLREETEKEAKAAEARKRAYAEMEKGNRNRHASQLQDKSKIERNFVILLVLFAAIGIIALFYGLSHPYGNY